MKNRMMRRAWQSGLLSFALSMLMAAAHATAPVLTMPAVNNVGANTATFSLQADQTGTGYFVLQSGATCGSGANVVAGQDNLAAPALRIGSLKLTANSAGTYTLRNLSHNTTYYVCFTADDGSNLQTTPTSISFTTTAAVSLRTTWDSLGAVGGYPAWMDFDAVGAPYFSYKDASSMVAVQKYSSGAFAQVGSAAVSPGAIDSAPLALAPDGTPYVFFNDRADPSNYRGTVLKFDGSTWVTVGNAWFTTGTPVDGSIVFAPDGTPYVAFVENPYGSSDYTSVVMKLVGATWTLVGSPGDFPTATSPPFRGGALAFDFAGTPYLAYVDSANANKLTVKKYSGSWTLVGVAAFSAGATDHPSLAFNPSTGHPYVAYYDDANGHNATVMAYDGSNWLAVGSPGFTPNGIYSPGVSLAFSPDGMPYVAYQDTDANGFLGVMRYASGSWSSVGTTLPAVGSYARLGFDNQGVPYALGRDLIYRLRADSAPAVTTTAASSLTPAGATLNGTVLNANTLSNALAYFDYGLTTAYGSNQLVSSVSGNGHATPISVSLSGLACNTTYHFRARAGNSVGTTYGSDLTFTTAACTTVPDAPTNIGVTAGNIQLTVSFSPPAPNGSSIDYYEATCLDSHGSGQQGTDPVGPSITVGALNNGVSYQCRVRAVNTNNGAGSYSSWSTWVTPVASNTTKPWIVRVAGVGPPGGNYPGDSSDGVLATAAQLSAPWAVAFDGSGNLYIADPGNNHVRKVNTSGIITTVAGNGAAGYSGDGGSATAARLNYPVGVAVDAAGNVYIVDSGNEVIRKVTPAGIITTVAGNGTYGYSGDNGPATSAQLGNPWGLAIDNARGKLYIAEAYNSIIRVLDLAGGTITTFAGTGVSGGSGDGGPATAAQLGGPRAVALDAVGNLYIADGGTIRMVDTSPSHIISTIPGGFGDLRGVAVNAAGDIYIADSGSGNNSISKISASNHNNIQTVAGTGPQAYNGDNSNAAAASLATPAGIAVDAYGNLFIADNVNRRIREIGFALPGTPTVTATAGDGQASFSFTPAANGSPLDAYAVTVNGTPITLSGAALNASASGGGYTATITNISGGVVTITVTGLSNGTAYVFTVAVSNAAGNGSVSAASNSVTPVSSVVAPPDPDPTPPPPTTTPGGTTTPVTNTNTVFETPGGGSTGVTVDNSGSIVVSSGANNSTLTLNSSVPESVAIKQDAGVTVTYQSATGGGALTITPTSSDTIILTKKVGNQTILEVAQGTANIQPSGGATVSVASSSDGKTIYILTFDPPTAADGRFAAEEQPSVIVRRDDQGINTYIENGKANYQSTDKDGTTQSSLPIYAGETANISNQGALDQIKIGSLDGDRNLPGDPLKSIPNIDPGLVIPQLDGKVNRLGGDSLIDSFKNQIDTALGSPPGAEVSFDPSSGVVVYKLNGVEARFIPLGNLLVSLTGFADNGFVAGNPTQAATGTFTLIDRGVQLTLASTLGYFNDFNAAVKATDPAGKVTLKSSGAIWIDMQGSQYITQPGYLAESGGVAGKPGVLLGANGQLSFRDSKGGVQTLYPTLADAATLQGTLAGLAPGASVRLQGDGTAAASVLGNNYTLLPQYPLIAIPGKYSGSTWWLENGTLYYTLPSLGKAQGFTVK